MTMEDFQQYRKEMTELEEEIQRLSSALRKIVGHKEYFTQNDPDWAKAFHDCVKIARRALNGDETDDC